MEAREDAAPYQLSHVQLPITYKVCQQCYQVLALVSVTADPHPDIPAVALRALASRANVPAYIIIDDGHHEMACVRQVWPAASELALTPPQFDRTLDTLQHGHQCPLP